MAEAREPSVILTLNAAPSLEEPLVDWLLARDEAREFTTYTVFEHGGAHERLSVAEQVSGRRRRVEFRIELPGSALPGLIAALAASFRSADMSYLATPVLASGDVGHTANP
jgi:hypothetical protein